MKKIEKERVVTAFQIDRDTWEEFRALIADKDISAARFIRGAIRDFIAKCKAAEEVR